MFLCPPTVNLHEAEIKKLSDSWRSLPSKCPFWRLYWHDKPGAYIELADGTEYHFTPQVIHLVSPDLIGKFQLSGYPRQLYLHFTASSPFTYLSPQAWPITKTAETQYVLKKCLKLLAGKRDNKFELAILCTSLVHLALAKLPQEHMQNANNIDSRISHALRILDESGQGISNNSLSKITSLAENSFIRLFKKEVGLSPQKYSMNIRINKACIMLRYHTYSLKEISIKLGFYDRYHFSKEFKKVTGFTPKKYKEVYTSVDGS